MNDQHNNTGSNRGLADWLFRRRPLRRRGRVWTINSSAKKEERE